MSNQQLSIPELLLSLDSPELQEAELVRAAVNQQLSTDRGGLVLSSLVDYYLDSSSSQVVQLLSSIREPHHKVLLEKLNESLNRSGSRLGGLTLLGHLIRKQPPWVHHISRSSLLCSLLRLLKTETDVVVLITGVLVLITLLPMIPQAGKQHIYDFFDVFGRLASWSYKNPGQVPVVHLVHLQAAIYSLFHRLYGMFPCNFISYLRLHYSMKENLDTFQEVVKPMLEHVRVHPELVTGTQDYELDPSRWRCYEVHDIVIECSRVSLDPLESSCEEDTYSLRDLNLNQTFSPLHPETSSGSLCERPGQLILNSCSTQADDVTWSPSSHCSLSTPPPEPAALGSTHPLSRTASVSSSSKCPSSSLPAAVSMTMLDDQDGGHTHHQVKLTNIQPITEQEGREPRDVINKDDHRQPPSPSFPPTSPSSPPTSSSRPALLTSTPGCEEVPPAPPSPPCCDSLCFTPPHPSSTPHRPEEGCSALSTQSPVPYESLFELALPRAATLFISRRTQEMLEKSGGGGGEDREEEQTSVSPLEVLDQMIVHGHDAHQQLSRRLSGLTKSLDRSHYGGKQLSMRTKGGEELQALRCQLLLVHSQLQYERFKRQQHAVRNRRLLRRVINATALEEHSVAMKGQLSVQDEEIRSLKASLQEEQRRRTHLEHDTHTHTQLLNTHITQLLQQRQDEQREQQRLQSELQESQSRLRDLEAELQRANNKAYNAEHQLAQLSIKLSSSQQQQQQIFLLNQQLVLLRETNRVLVEQLEAAQTQQPTEAYMLQCTVGNDYQRLKDSDVQQRQKLEAANHRVTELEAQLALRDQLILDQKKLLEDTKTQSRCELAACEGLCVALRRITQTLQTETLQLYSQIQVDSGSRTQDLRPNGGGVAVPAPHKLRPFSSSSGGLINGGVEALSTSPLLLPSCSSSPLSLSPIESPLAVGSFLEQRSRQLFRPTNHSPEGEEPQLEEEEQEEEQQEEVQPESPPLGQDAETLLTGSPPETLNQTPSGPPGLPGPPGPLADLTFAVRQRRHELSIMDYDEALSEY